MTEILKEARRLYTMGCGVHFIKPNSKAPVVAGWADGTRQKWSELERSYRKGYGLGVRLGAASKLENGFLANIDVDIKSDDPAHRKEALDFVRERFPGLLKSAPVVKTGMGLRLFVVTREPVQSQRLTSSGELCVCLMPTAEMNRQQQKAIDDGVLTEKQAKRGYRVRPAWEVEFMSAGKQVVLPPSIHPDTSKPYVWSRELVDTAGLPLVKLGAGVATKRDVGAKHKFKECNVDYFGLSERCLSQVLHGTGVEDRSAACLSVTMAMLRAGYTDDEICSLLTDPDTFLGQTAYEHRDTRDRAYAADWVYRYCIRKARDTVGAENAFGAEVVETPVLEDDDAAKQKKALLGVVGKRTAADIAAGKTSDGWVRQLARSGKNGDGGTKPTLANVLLVLRNAVGCDVFKFDMFRVREVYGADAPWNEGKAGKLVEDSDAIAIKTWMADQYDTEPNVSVIFEAITQIARENRFHPIREWYDSLPKWDGTPRVNTWLAKHFGATEQPAEYTAQVLRKWMLASVTRVYEPGAKFDWMPILEGKQGTGKSLFAAKLFGQEFFADWLPKLDDKDAALQLCGKLCVEFGELEMMRRNEVETTKAFVSRQIDTVRPPYGRKPVEHKRQVVFIGSTNKDTYFRDDSGNRRFMPVVNGVLDGARLDADREQLWAEILHLYRNGPKESLYLDNGAAAHALEVQQHKMVEDESAFMAEEIRKFRKQQKKLKHGERFDFGRFKSTDLFQNGAPLQKWNEGSREIQFAAKALRKLNYERYFSCGTAWWRPIVDV